MDAFKYHVFSRELLATGCVREVILSIHDTQALADANAAETPGSLVMELDLDMSGPEMVGAALEYPVEHLSVHERSALELHPE